MDITNISVTFDGIMGDKLINWLKSKSGYLKISRIERDLNMPEGTLKKYIDGERSLAEKWESAVVEWVKNFKK